MLNLAPVKYANCHASNGGPLHSIEQSSIEFNGARWYVANTRLSDHLRPKSPEMHLFAEIDGTGLDRIQLHAKYKAISEALERWAHHSLSGTSAEEKKRYGFDHDPTSNGMAAFPGFFARQARAYALREAIERYAVVAWWNGSLGMEALGQKEDSPYLRFRILHGFKSHEVVVMRLDLKKGYSVFSFGGGRSLASAEESAMLELERSRILLEKFYQRNPGIEVGDLSTITDPWERRIVFFSMPEGVECFEAKLTETCEIKGSPSIPEIIVDGEITGPWSKYATVWRVLFRMPTLDFLNDDHGFFFW